MAKLKHRIEYFFARSMVALANSLSQKTAGKFSKGLGNVFYYLLSSRRKIALENLNQAFGYSVSFDKRKEITRNVFQNIAATFVELARFEQLGHKQLNEMVIPGGLDYFQKAREQGNGAVIVTSHFGNWELGAAWVVSQGYPLDVVAKVQSNELVDRLISSLRKKMGVNIIPVKSSTLRDIMKSLKDNNFVAMVADQHDPSGNMILDFFGRPASVAKGPATFARKQNCPLLPFMTHRLGYQKHVVLAHPPIFPDNNLDDERDIQRMTKLYLTYFEEIITQYPGQWMWTHRRWKI